MFEAHESVWNTRYDRQICQCNIVTLRKPVHRVQKLLYPLSWNLKKLDIA